MEIVGIIGALLMLVGWIWLVIIAFTTSGAVWGILNFFFQPITGIIFCIVKKVGWMQLAMMIVGLLLAGAGLAPTMAKMTESMPR